MRELHYENQNTKTYLVYTIEEQDSIDSMSLGMLTNNKIRGLAQTLFTQMDSQKFIKFNVSAKVSVSQFFSGAVNKKRLLGVFTGIVNAMLSAEDYMLDPASIIMDLNYIFTDVSTCETDLICLPVIETEMKQNDLGMFFRNIMFNTQFDQTENCDHVAKIINYLNSTSLFSLTDFKRLLEGIQDQKVQPVVTMKTNDSPASAVLASQQKKQTQPTVTQTQPAQQLKTIVSPASADIGMNIPHGSQKPPVTQVTTESAGSEISFFYLMQHYNKENAAAYKAQKKAKKKAAVAAKGKTPAQQPPVQKKTQSVAQPAVLQKAAQGPTTDPHTQKPAFVSRQIPQGQGMNFGETTILGGGAPGETTVLTVAQNPAKMIAPYLIRKKNSEKISLNKPLFRVGKEGSYVDYFIGDNTAISRSHANFITRDGEYFIVDTNSTNHTFVNGTMIQSNVETQISHGDTIRLANEDFEFKLY